MFRHKKKQEEELANPFVGGASADEVAAVNGPTESEVETAIKEAEAAANLPADELLEAGDEQIINPEPIPENEAIDTTELSDAEVETLAAAAQAELAGKTAESESSKIAVEDKPKEEIRPNIAVDSVSTGNEFDDLVAWSERDTASKAAKIQKTIDGLEQRINNISAEMEHDTDGLSADAKNLFEKNTHKNIELIKDQIEREEERQARLERKRDTFISKVQAALKEYTEIPVVDEFKTKQEVGGNGSSNNGHK